MKAQNKHRIYVILNENEWLELAAALPRGNSLRDYCQGRAVQRGLTWAEFSISEWLVISEVVKKAEIELIWEDVEFK